MVLSYQREEAVNDLRKRKFDLIFSIETKMKENEERARCGVGGICARVQENERIKEGAVILLNGVWYSVAVDFGCICSRMP